MSIRIPIGSKNYETKFLFVKPSISSPSYRVVKIIGCPLNGTQSTWYLLNYLIRRNITNGTCSLVSYTYGTTGIAHITPDTGYNFPQTVTVTGSNAGGYSTSIAYSYDKTVGDIIITGAQAGTVEITITGVCESTVPLIPPVINLTLPQATLTITPGQGDQEAGYYYVYAKKYNSATEIILAENITKNLSGAVTCNIVTLLDSKASELSYGAYNIYARQTPDGTQFSADSNVESMGVNLLHLTVIENTETTTNYVLLDNIQREIAVTPTTGYDLPTVIMVNNEVGTTQRQGTGITTTWSWSSSYGTLTIKTTGAEINGRILCSSAVISAPEASLIKGVGNEGDSLYIVDTDGRAETYTVWIDNVNTGQTIIKG